MPTRQSYVMAPRPAGGADITPGVTGLVRLGGWAAAPFVAGPLMQRVSLIAPLLLGSGMKIGYDLLLWKGSSNAETAGRGREANPNQACDAVITTARNPIS